MLRAFATIKTAMRIPIATRHALEKRMKMSSPSPLPVASAVRSQISCTAAMRGKVTNATHNIPSPNRAPACA